MAMQPSPLNIQPSQYFGTPSNRLKDLKEGKYYTISLGEKEDIILINIIVKLENSMNILFVESKVKKWLRSHHQIIIYDEVPLSYFRKEKLEKINESVKD